MKSVEGEGSLAPVIRVLDGTECARVGGVDGAVEPVEERGDSGVAARVGRSSASVGSPAASELEWHIANDGGLHRTHINELNHALRRMLRNRGGDYVRPIELVNQRLQALD